MRADSLRALAAALWLGLGLCACGGGGGSGSTAPAGPPLPLVPNVVGDDRISAEATITGSGYVVGTETNQATTAMAAGGVLSQSPAAGTGAAKGTVVSLVLATPAQAAPSATLVSDSGRTAFSYLSLNLWVNAVAWDATNNLLLVVTGNSSPTHASEVLSVNPTTGTIVASHSVPGQGLAVATSADGQYTYVGLDLGGGVRRFVTKTLAADISIPVGDATTYIQDIQVSPVNAHTIAVTAWYLQTLTKDPGVAVFDDAVMRPTIFAGNHTYPDPNRPYLNVNAANTAWSPDGAQLYVFNQVNIGLYQLAVGPQGLALSNWLYWVPSGGVGGRLRGTRAYIDGGQVVDLAGPVQLLGQYPFSNSNMMYHAELPASGKSFSVRDHIGYSILGLPYVDGLTIWASDLSTFSAVDSTTILGIASATFGRLYTWGSDGLVWADPARLLIGRGSFTQAGGAPPAASSPPQVLSTSVTGTAGALSVRAFLASVTDVAADRCGNLYATTAGSSGFYPNSVVALDPSTAAVKGHAYAGSEPTTLTVSSDCTTLYATLAQSSSIARINAASMALEKTIALPLDANWGLVRARSVAVAPGAPQTLAVATQVMGADCLATDEDVRIYDDATQRSVVFTGAAPIYGVRSVAFGDSANTLYAYELYNANLQPTLLSLTVDGSGVYGPVELMRVHGGLVQDGARMLTFDPAAARIYDREGGVFDTHGNVALGPISLNTAVAEYSQCGTPNTAVTTDRSTGKIFYVTYANDDSGLVLDVYDKASLALLGTAKLPFSQTGANLGMPARVTRSGTNALAVATTGGYLLYLQGSMLGP